MSYPYPYPPQPTWPAYQTRRTSAPASLHVVAIFQYLGGGLTLLGAVLLALGSTAGLARLRSAGVGGTLVDRPYALTVVLIICAFIGLIGLIAIILGRKVQRGRNWARIVLIILYVLSLLGDIAQVAGYRQYAGTATVGAAPIGSALVTAAFAVLCLVLLNTRAARSWCHYRTY